MDSVERNYRIEGLNCAECAAKIERGATGIPGVSACDISLLTESVRIKTLPESSEETTLRQLRDLADRIEPGTRIHEVPQVTAAVAPTMTQQVTTPVAEDGGLKTLRRQIYAGAVIFVLAELAQRLLRLPFAWVTAIFIVAYAILGTPVLLKAGKNILRGKVFDENFLMSLATVGAFFIGSPEEAFAVMLFYQVGEAFQMSALHRSQKSVRELLALRPDYANRKTADGIEVVHPDVIIPGEIIIVRPGERVPLDGQIVAGEAMLDTSALTGESLPRDVQIGDSVNSGTVNMDGVLEIRVTSSFGESTASKMVALVTEAAARKSKTETVITRFARIYTPVVVISALLLFLVPVIFFAGDPREWMYRALSFLVISCPCALVLSVPLGYFAGIGAAGRSGIFVKGGGVFDALSTIRTVVLDKTGTLTDGTFSVTNVSPVPGISEEDLLRTAVTAERFSDHPIAVSVLAEGQKREVKHLEIEPSLYKEIAGRGIRVDAPEGMILAGNARLLEEQGVEIPKDQAEGGTLLYIAQAGRFVGSLLLTDLPKTGAREALAEMHSLGVNRLIMLTGDRSAPASATARELGIDVVHAELLPAEKLEKLEEVLSGARKGETVLFAGDGINDAAVLARADVGAAIGLKASGAAVEAADLVVMKEDIRALPLAIRIAKRTQIIIRQSIVLSLVVKGVILVAAALGYSNLWLAVFADVGVTLLAVLNSLRAGRSRQLR